MSRSIRIAAVALLGLGGSALASPAEAGGWHRHHHRHHHVRVRHDLRVHSYEPRLGQVSLLPAWGCGLQRLVTHHGALAYRQVCY
jgi:hypothetical protein